MNHGFMFPRFVEDLRGCVSFLSTTRIAGSSSSTTDSFTHRQRICLQIFRLLHECGANTLAAYFLSAKIGDDDDYDGTCGSGGWG
jgi:hypothetical protein